MSEPYPLPWTAEEQWHGTKIKSSAGAVCRVHWNKGERGNAELILRAVNAYPALVTALERLVGCLSESPDDSPPYVPTLCDDCREFGRATLDAVKGDAS